MLLDMNIAIKENPDMKNSIQPAMQIKILAENADMCFECDAEHCAFNPKGICKFPLVYDCVPEMTEEDGCLDMLSCREERDVFLNGSLTT